MSESRDALTAWLRAQLGVDDLRIEGLDRVEFGHSAEMMVLIIVTADDSRDVVLRLRPRPPALLEPYDLKRQFEILLALEKTPVHVTRYTRYDEATRPLILLGLSALALELLIGSTLVVRVP